MWGIIATWRMALEGIEAASTRLAAGESAGGAVELSLRAAEDVEYYKSIGYGGLPNEEMDVELDAGFMDGDTLGFGAIGAARDVANPISLARSLASGQANNFLVGCGAGRYADRAGFERRNMLTDRARAWYRRRLAEEGRCATAPLVEPEASEERARGAVPVADPALESTGHLGHDTVGVACLDTRGALAAGASTSGLFMKKPGRVGDSAVPGAGFYADSEIGAAASTGLGEDVMKGCVAFEIVRLMGTGLTPQRACEQAVHAISARLRRARGTAGDISFVAMDARGRWGAASNIEGFSLAVATSDEPARVLLAHPDRDGCCSFEVASQTWMDEYVRSRMAPVVA